MNNYQNLMRGRLGLLTPSYNSSVNTELLDAKLKHEGGTVQQQRMIKGKLRSLRSALYNSYQGAFVKLLGQGETEPVRALINPNKVKQDYDDKIISIEYDYNFKCGDIFEWCDTNTYWIIYLQDLTEHAYFRGDVRKCNYSIQWENEAGQLVTTYAAVRGPVEANIDSTTKNGTSVDLPNSSLNIIIPKNEETLKYFKRYNKFFLSGNKDICWRIEGIDSVSGDGIIEVSATEYYINRDEDDAENGIVGGLVNTIVQPEQPQSNIQGESLIQPKVTYVYNYIGENQNGFWSFDKNLPIIYSISEDGLSISVKWNKTIGGKFDLSFGEANKSIIVDSLF